MNWLLAPTGDWFQDWIVNWLQALASYGSALFMWPGTWMLREFQLPYSPSLAFIGSWAAWLSVWGLFCETHDNIRDWRFRRAERRAGRTYD